MLLLAGFKNDETGVACGMHDEKCIHSFGRETLKRADHMRARRMWKDNIKMDHTKIEYGSLTWSHMAEDVELWASADTVMNLQVL
jgi:alkaline phosphatase